MFIAINGKGVESMHETEPYYNQLHDRWDSFCKIHAPRGILKLLGIDNADIAKYEINHLDSKSKAIVESVFKIYKKGSMD